MRRESPDGERIGSFQSPFTWARGAEAGRADGTVSRSPERILQRSARNVGAVMKLGLSLPRVAPARSEALVDRAALGLAETHDGAGQVQVAGARDLDVAGL